MMANYRQCVIIKSFGRVTVKTVFTGRTNFVTVDMVTGKPKRMPAEFIEAYIPALTSP